METKKYSVQDIKNLFWRWVADRDIQENNTFVQSFILWIEIVEKKEAEKNDH